MPYLALATDYDGTLAHHGRVDDATRDAVRRLRASGRRVLLVTGRQLPDLEATCPCLDLFDWVVAENGALLYQSATGTAKPLAAPPPEKFLQALRGRGVQPLSVGRVIVATWEPHEKAVRETIRDLGLELQVIFNKGAVMVLPSGVNKATGLAAALAALGLTADAVVGIGDAENDHAFLNRCAVAVAVANALPVLKEQVDWVTPGDHGAGVRQLIDVMLSGDLAGRVRRRPRPARGTAAPPSSPPHP